MRLYSVRFFHPANFQPSVPYHIILSAVYERISVY